MRDYKNINRLFQEKLKTFEVFPPNNAWNKIENNLVPIKKKSKISSTAAIILLVFSISIAYFSPKKTITKQFLNSGNNKQVTNTDTVLATKEISKTLETKINTAKKIDVELLEKVANTNVENIEIDTINFVKDQLLKDKNYHFQRLLII